MSCDVLNISRFDLLEKAYPIKKRPKVKSST
jgi:hypothetical protein